MAEAEVKRAKNENRLRALVRQTIAESTVVADQVDKEVDRAFGHTLSLITFLLALATLVPLLFVAVAWTLRNTIKSQLADQIREQFKGDAGKLADVAIEQLNQKLNSHLEIASSTFASRLARIPMEDQQKKDKIIKEIHALRTVSAPSFMEGRRSKDISLEDREKLKQLVKSLEKLKEISPDILFSVDDYIEEGRAVYLTGDYGRALELFAKAIELDPQNVNAWFHQGEALRQLEERDAAIKSYQTATALDPQSPLGWIGSGYALEEMKLYDDARQAYTMALDMIDKKITVEHDNCRWWSLKGNALCGLGRQEEAILAFDEALQINPSYYEVLVNRGMSFRRLNRLNDAIASCEQAITLRPDFPSAWYNKACYHALKGELAFLFASLGEAVRLSSLCGKWAKSDKDFEVVSEAKEFRALVG